MEETQQDSCQVLVDHRSVRLLEQKASTALRAIA
jgi:hypothetical protein